MMAPRTLALALVLATAAVAGDQDHDHGASTSEVLGTVSFATSCNAAAQPQFNRAVALLHSFEFCRAIDGFGATLKADPGCAIAEWGIAHGAHRVHLLADVANLPSQVVARRAGFIEEGRMRACLPYRDRPHGDAVLFSRLPGDPAPG